MKKQNDDVWCVWWMLMIMTLLAIVSFCTCTFGAKPTVTFIDPNTISFPWDPNQVTDPNRIVGFQTINPDTQWVRDWHTWCSTDKALVFSVNHGTSQRTSVVVDSATGEKQEIHKVTLNTPNNEGVLYLKGTVVVGSDPNISATSEYLLNVTAPPAELEVWTYYIPWWIPHVDYYFAHDSSDLIDDKLENWQKFAKAIQKYAPMRTEVQINNELFLANQRGEIAMP